MKSQISNVLEAVDADQINVEDRFSFVELVYLKKWPKDILDSLKAHLTEQDYTIYNNHATRYFYSDPSGEYQTESVIVRSIAINNADEKTYMAIYNTEGGEWGRFQCFRKIYLLDSKGLILHSERHDLPYCNDFD